jgi:NAD(P)-dependent dehydrogenase (short-subunit alcohol dehydrogenase family)
MEQMGRLSGKVVLVTGAACGRGRAAAELFACEGAKVIATDVNDPQPAYADDGINFSKMDVANENDWKTIIASIVSRYGRLDVLVNNAGIGGSFESIENETVDAWNRVVAVNQTGVFLGMREVIPVMRSQNGGSIINLASIWGLVAVPNIAAYHATKGAVCSLTKNAAVNYAADGIRVNSLHPGIVATPTIQALPHADNNAVVARTPLGRMAQPIELAYGMLFLASDESSFMTGSELVIDGGLTAQ